MNDSKDWIDLSGLPKHGKIGISARKSIGHIVKFKCGYVVGELKIVSYDKDTRQFLVEYNGEFSKIYVHDFMNCRLKTLTHQVIKGYVYNVGDVVNGFEVMELTTKRVDNCKSYKCKCCKCGFETVRRRAEMEHCCPICDKSMYVIKGVNDCLTTHPFMKDYVIDVSALSEVTSSSPKKLKCKCPLCSTEKMCSPWELRFNGFACKRCGDGLTYPEKLISEMLRQLNVNFIAQANKKTFDWCENYRYDFYLPDHNTIIETHGEQHYTDCFKWTKKTLEEIQNNDTQKECLAISSGVSKYVVLDCRESEVNWIKDSIASSELPNILNFSIDNIDWDKCLKYINTPIIIQIVELWNKGIHSTVEIGNEVGLTKSTVRKYLKIANGLNLCTYNIEIVNKYRAKKISKTRKKT